MLTKLDNPNFDPFKNVNNAVEEDPFNIDLREVKGIAETPGTVQATPTTTTTVVATVVWSVVKVSLTLRC